MNEEVRSKTEKGYNYAIYLLSLKLRTEGEIREKMKGKKYQIEVINKVTQQLYENKYLDDAKYAEVYLENLKKYKSFGFYGIKKKLMDKRLPSLIIENVLSEGLSVEDEVKIAKRFIAKKDILDIGDKDIESTDDLDIQEENRYSTKTYGEQKDPAEIKKQKTLAKLKSRGFRGETISKVLSKS